MRTQPAVCARFSCSAFRLSSRRSAAVLLTLAATVCSDATAEDQFATSELGFDGFYYHYQTDCCQNDPTGHFGTMTSSTQVSPLGCSTTPLENGLPMEIPPDVLVPVPQPGPIQPGPAPLGGPGDSRPQHFLPAGPQPKAPERYGRVISNTVPIKDVDNGPVHGTAVKITDANGVTRYFTLVRYKATVNRTGGPGLNPAIDEVVETFMLLFPRRTANIKINSPQGDYSIVPQRVLPPMDELRIQGSFDGDRREYLTLDIPGIASDAKALMISPKEIE